MTNPDPASEPICVLLVEDSDADARMFEVVLDRMERGRFRCTRADRLKGVRDCLRDDSFDVVVLDLSLPDSDGVATFTTMRGLAPEIAIVVLTGYQDDDLAAELLKAGARGVLFKGSCSGGELVRTLREAAGAGA